MWKWKSILIYKLKVQTGSNLELEPKVNKLFGTNLVNLFLSKKFNFHSTAYPDSTQKSHT